MESIFEENSFNKLKNRIGLLQDNSDPLWGKMAVGQMLWHCQGPLNIMLENNDYGMKPNWLVKVLFKKSLYNDKPWRKNLPTAKFLKTSESKDFNSEKGKLLSLAEEIYASREKSEWNPHPSFGYFTKAQWGQMQFKHLDHHLKQFGV